VEALHFEFRFSDIVGIKYLLLSCLGKMSFAFKDLMSYQLAVKETFMHEGHPVGNVGAAFVVSCY